MTFPFTKHFGQNYQKIREYGSENKFRIVENIAVVKPLNHDDDFIVDVETWNNLPWSGWKLNKSGYISCCNVPLH